MVDLRNGKMVMSGHRIFQLKKKNRRELPFKFDLVLYSVGGEKFPDARQYFNFADMIKKINQITLAKIMLCIIVF